MIDHHRFKSLPAINSRANDLSALEVNFQPESVCLVVYQSLNFAHAYSALGLFAIVVPNAKKIVVWLCLI